MLKNSDYEVLTPSGFKDFDGVKESIREDNILFTFDDSSTILVTPEHRFFCGASSKGKIFRRANKININHVISKKRVIKKEYNVETEHNKYYDLINVADGNIYNTSSIISHNCAHVDDTKFANFEDSVMPTIATADNTKIIQISTPKGMNHFYKDVQEAKNDINGYVFFEVTWHDIDFYTEQWSKSEIKRIGPVAFNQNYNVAFLGSSSTLVRAEDLADMVKAKPIIEDYLHDGCKLYKEYDETKLYLMAIDTSKTVGKDDAENDYICINVLELSDTSIEQVCVYRTNDIHYKDIAQIAYDIGEAFNYPSCVVENNEGSGTYTANYMLDELDYPEMYFDPNKDGLEVGVRTTSKNRPIGLTTIRKLIENEILIINDADTVDEFYTFVKVGKKYTASSGNTDDCIMSLNCGMYFLMDENNDLEVTINDYLADGEIIIEEREDESLDFFSGNNGYTHQKDWLTG